MVRARVAGWAGSLAVVLGVLGLAGPAGQADEKDERAAGGTDVLLATDAPLRPGRNAVWCATGQLAWDAAADALEPGGSLALGPPAPPDLVKAMNRRTFPHADLDAESTVVVGGIGKDGVVERARKAWAERFPGTPAPNLTAGPDDLLGFAALKKSLPFETPFRRRVTTFAGGKTVFRAFGMLHDDHAPDVEAMASQVTVWFDKEPSEAYDRDWRPVWELAPKGGRDRIVLSALPPGATLEATWRQAADRIAAGHSLRLSSDEDMLIPRVRLDIEHRFRELEGAPLEGIPGSRLQELSQHVAFGLTEKGATVESEARILLTLGIGLKLKLDGPFLLALLRTGARRPYLLVWVANEDLLERWEPPPPAKGEALAPFLGKWTLDLERSIAAGVEQALLMQDSELEDPEQPGKPLSEAGARALARKDVEAMLKGATATMEVGADATLSLRFRLESVAEQMPEGASMGLGGHVVVQDRRVLLRVETEDGKPAEEDSYLLLRRKEEWLHLDLPNLFELVFRRP